ncbi:MAG: RNA methyltransferase [Prevotella sp.]|nr:RNA methyltransferase [Prevotella sp.]
MRKLRTIEMNRLSVDQFRQSEKLPLIVVLDDVRSLHNVGSVFRTCDAFRVEALWLCGITAIPTDTKNGVRAEIHKTALGAEESVSWQYFPTAQEAVRQLHDNHFSVFAIEQAEGSTPLQQFRVQDTQPRGCAVILGNEVKGVHQEVIDLCDGCLEIPQFGTKHSMNVSVAAGIVIWEFARQLLLIDH